MNPVRMNRFEAQESLDSFLQKTLPAAGLRLAHLPARGMIRPLAE
jgi:hypothetical protein